MCAVYLSTCLIHSCLHPLLYVNFATRVRSTIFMHHLDHYSAERRHRPISHITPLSFILWLPLCCHSFPGVSYTDRQPTLVSMLRSGVTPCATDSVSNRAGAASHSMLHLSTIKKYAALEPVRDHLLAKKDNISTASKADISTFKYKLSYKYLSLAVTKRLDLGGKLFIPRSRESSLYALYQIRLSPQSWIDGFCVVPKLVLTGRLSSTVSIDTVQHILIVCFLFFRKQFRFFQNLLEDHHCHVLQTAIVGNSFYSQHKV